MGEWNVPFYHLDLTFTSTQSLHNIYYIDRDEELQTAQQLRVIYKQPIAA